MPSAILKLLIILMLLLMVFLLPLLLLHILSSTSTTSPPPPPHHHLHTTTAHFSTDTSMCFTRCKGQWVMVPYVRKGHHIQSLSHTHGEQLQEHEGTNKKWIEKETIIIAAYFLPLYAFGFLYGQLACNGHL